MAKRLDIGGEHCVIPLLREAVEIMSSDPQKYGLCGHKVNQLLPVQTLNSFDISVRIKVPLDSPAGTSICDCWQIDVECREEQ